MVASALPFGQLRPVVCTCGSDEFEPVPVIRAQSNRLKPSELQIQNLSKLVCWKCGFSLIHKNGEWITINER